MTKTPTLPKRATVFYSRGSVAGQCVIVFQDAGRFWLSNGAKIVGFTTDRAVARGWTV